MLRRETWNVGELEIAVLRQRVANAQVPAIHHADHVTGPRFLDGVALASHELLRRCETDHLARAHVSHLHPGLEFPRAHAHEGDAITMFRVHVRLDLEDEPGELVARRLDGADRRFARRGGWRQLEELPQERFDAEVR